MILSSTYKSILCYVITCGFTDEIIIYSSSNHLMKSCEHWKTSSSNRKNQDELSEVERARQEVKEEATKGIKADMEVLHGKLLHLEND